MKSCTNLHWRVYLTIGFLLLTRIFPICRLMNIYGGNRWEYIEGSLAMEVTGVPHLRSPKSVLSESGLDCSPCCRTSSRERVKSGKTAIEAARIDFMHASHLCLLRHTCIDRSQQQFRPKVNVKESSHICDSVVSSYK